MNKCWKIETNIHFFFASTFNLILLRLNPVCIYVSEASYLISQTPQKSERLYINIIFWTYREKHVASSRRHVRVKDGHHEPEQGSASSRVHAALHSHQPWQPTTTQPASAQWTVVSVWPNDTDGWIWPSCSICGHKIWWCYRCSGWWWSNCYPGLCLSGECSRSDSMNVIQHNKPWHFSITWRELALMRNIHVLHHVGCDDQSLQILIDLVHYR